MRDTVQAEDGDEVSVVTTAISLEQAIIEIEIENKVFDFVEIFSLTPTRARELADALRTAADVVEQLSLEEIVSTPTFISFTESPGTVADTAFYSLEQDNAPGQYTTS